MVQLNRPLLSIAMAFIAILSVSLLLMAVFGGLSLADPGQPEPDQALPTFEEVRDSIESPNPSPPAPPTNPEAAEDSELEDLTRGEALDIFDGVFSRQIEAPAGIFDELQVDRFLAPGVAVVGGDSEEAAAEETPLPAQPQEAGEEEPGNRIVRDTAPGAASDPEVSGATMLDSTIPLQAESDTGETEPIDLTLERVDGMLLPTAPLVDVSLPGELHEGIDLPDSGIHVNLPGTAAATSPSILGGTVAFYPNVSEDTDFAVSPAPKGFETLTQLRSPEAPTTEEFELELPDGAVLRPSGSGGAEVTRDGTLLMSIEAPTAIDAEGESVPVRLAVSGESLKVTVEPGSAADFPILLDPLFQTYEWDAKGTDAGICSNSFQTETSSACNYREEWGYDVHEYPWGGFERHMEATNGIWSYGHGMHIWARRQQRTGDHATILYTVPRYFKDVAPPTSYIKRFKLSDLTWSALSPSPSPYLFAGIWDPFKPGWINPYYLHTSQVGHGTNEPAYVYDFKNETINNGKIEPNTNGKVAEVSINATEDTAESSAHVYAGYAQVELGDDLPPQAPVPTAQSKWANQSAPPLQFSTGDSGLGVFAVTASTEEGLPFVTWKAANGCVGVGDSACPLSWSSSEAKQPLTYDPKVLPTGVRYLKLVAEDPLGNKSAGSWEEVRIDHTAPTLAITGPITEQDQLGTRRATYLLKATGADGVTGLPQSGIAKAEIKLDGKAVAMEGKQAEEWSPKCASQNCPLAAEWTLSTAGLAEGNHTVEVIATDAVGNSTTKALTIETHTATPPTLALSDSITEQASLGTSRPRYVLKAKSTATAAGFEMPTLGAPASYAATLGTYGEGTSRFFEPIDAATDGKGNVWILDSQTRVANQLQQFNEKGEWLRSTGSTGYGKLKTPWGVAVDTGGNVWVADTGNNRIVEFNEKGEFVLTFGVNVNKTKVEAAGTEVEKNLCTAASGNVCQPATAGSLAGQLKSPKGIALTSGGNVWVADTGNNRIEKFGPTGTLINNVSGEGTEPGKLKSPTAITVAPDNSIWVVDNGNNRIEQWNSSLAFVRAVGTKGTGGGEFQNPTGIEADSTGAVWVSDYSNGRVQEFDEFGTFIQKFLDAAGSSGTPRGLAIDAKGSLWIADQYLSKVYRWSIPGFPVNASSAGTSGSGNGQFYEPVDVAADSSGNFWVVDPAQNRLQEFDSTGKWLRNAGAAGSGAGKLSLPRAAATDSKGNVWVADTGNNRIVEFSEKGEFVLTFGTNVNKTKVDAAGTEAEKNLCTAASGNVCQAATVGSLAGQLKFPKGIALTSSGNVWVADTGNSRIEKFGPTGNLINLLNGNGTSGGLMKEPAGIAVAPDASIWVADTGNNRIEQWNSSLSLVRVVGKEGSGGGEFKAPVAIEADSSGNIWVGDQKNNRVEEFGEGGRYLGQFGANGSGKFSFSTGAGIAVDATGNIWVADPGHTKVQKWTQEVPRSEITTTLWLDNTQQTGLRGTCKSAGCTIEPQWTVESKGLSAGSHSAKVKTTDGLGRSTESTVSFQITPDTTKPTLEAGGELVNAPEGWVEQETYGFNATATDGGAGVTSIVFKIDGQQVASASQTCPDGGCNETLSKQISMAGYAGGAHPAEIVTTDGAGNASKKQWTINVDPEGHISTEEAEATLEAAENTTEETPIAPNNELLEPEQIENGDNPELRQVGSEIISTGAPDLTTMTTTPAAGFTINSPYGETTIVPATSEATSSTTIAEGVAAVSANVRSEVDGVIRPEYNGVDTFQAIRSETSPDTYSWTVGLEEGQVLQLVSSEYAEVLYASGKRAFLITAEPAHDATGATVPTSLSVSGNVLTLKVDFHSGSFVYPILSGQGWETSYSVPVVIEGPEDEAEIREREEREDRERVERAREAQGEEAIPPTQQELEGFPEPHTQAQFDSFALFGAEELSTTATPMPAGAGKIRTVLYRSQCGPNCSKWNAKLTNASIWSKTDGSWSKWESGTEIHARIDQNWKYKVIFLGTMWNCGYIGQTEVKQKEHEHLTAYGHFTIEGWLGVPKGDKPAYEKNFTLFAWVYPNGYQEKHVNWEWGGSTLHKECPVGGPVP